MIQLGKRRPQPLVAPKVYLSISSEGFGHSSRAIAIASRFSREELLVGTYGYALKRLRQAGLDTVKVSQEFRLLGDEGSFDVSRTILENQSSLLTLNQMISEERDIMQAYGVTVVVADGRIAPVIAASRLGIPCLVLTNQSDFYPFFRHDSAWVKLFGKSFEWWMRTWLSSADEILIPDFYPPDTVCLLNLSPSFHVKKRTRFLGPLVSWRREDIVAVERPQGYKHYVVVSLGGHAYRKPLLDAVLAIAPQFPDTCFELLTSLPAFGLPPNVHRQGLVPDGAPYFKAADCVITQAGHSTAMELMTLGVPSVIVPDQAQSEQINNAIRMVSLGVSLRVDYEDTHVPTALLSEALTRVLTEGQFARKAERMAQKSALIDGPGEAAKILRAYSQRVLAY